MDKMRKIVEEKREKCSEKKPRFGMRKLSVGLVSCVLGYLTFVSPQTVIAETNANDNIIVSTASEAEKNKKSEEVETLYFDEIFKPELKSFNNVSVEDASAFASENSEKLYNVDENVSAAEESRKPTESTETNEST